MRLPVLQILLAMAVTLHATSTDAFSVAAQTRHSALTAPDRDNVLKTDRNGASSARSLRVEDTKSVKEDDNEISEERLPNVVKKVGKNIQVRVWLEAEKTDDFVLQALKLKGLSGTDLTTNANYKYFLKFAKKAEGYRLNKWLRKDVTTYQAWENLGMKNFRTVEQLEQIKGSDPFRIYKRYVNEFDDSVSSSLKAGYDPPAKMLSRGSDAEITARVQIMAESKRSESYAKVALGMTVPGKPKTTLKGDELMNHFDYKYYELFLAEAAKVAKRAN